MESRGNVAMADALLTTKLGVQTRSLRYVKRERLHALLESAPEARLVLVSAPAGFGKSALLGQWLLGCSHRFAWLSLDSADNDANRFMRYLRLAGNSLRGGGDGIPASRPAPPDVEIVVADLLEAFSCRPGRAVLILDDYHVIASSEVHAIVATLIDRLPVDASIVIATRADPPLALARLRARGELLEIRADALRFTQDEGAAFLRLSMGLDLRPDLVDELVARTEGWAAVLQLAAASLSNRNDRARAIREFGASNRFLLDFVVEEVLANETEETQEFLLRTSVLDRLTGTLCDAVTGRADGAATLARLERSNLPVFPLDEERRWYRYHHLFADLLRARLAARDPRLPCALHAKAAEWYEAAGQLGEAIEQSLRAPDVPRAQRLLRQHWMAVMHQGDLWTVQRWLDALPVETVREDPQLSVTYAFGQVLRGEAEAVESHIVDARAALESAGLEPIDRLLVPYQLELVEAKLRELLGDPGGLIEHARAALELVPTAAGPGLEALARGDATYMLARGQQLAGEDDAAVATLGEALPLLRLVGNVFTFAHGARDLVRIELRRGNAARALSLCDSLMPGEEASEPAAAGALHLARAEVLDALGDHSQALEDAGRAAALAHDGGDGSVRRDARALVERLSAAASTRRGATAASYAGGPRLIEALSARELEVLRLVATGRSNSQIAAELFVTVGTIKAHIHSISGKLGAANRVEAIVRGRESHLLD